MSIFGGDDEIGARLALKDRPKFSSDAERAASDVKRLGDSSDHTTRRSTTGFLRMRGAFGGLVTRVTGGVSVLLGAAGIGGLFLGIKSTMESASELQKITSQTESVLKSTGGAANITAKGVRDLANEINNYSLMDDDAVQSAENMLLTFTGVRNELGKGNDIFNQATKTAADMSTALGGDMKQSALQLGKALNDPIKGVGALRRVGVAFTQDQQDQIKTLVEHGNTLKAQKIILGELKTEFGGSAKAAGETFAGALFHVKDALQDTARDMLMPALPALTKGVNMLGDVVVPKFIGGLRDLKQQFHENGPQIKRTAGAVASVLGGAIKTVWHFITGTAIPVAKDLWHIVGPLLTDAAHGLAGAIKRMGGFLDGAGGVIKSVTGFMSDHATIMRVLIVMVGTAYGAWKIWTLSIKAWQAVTKAGIAVQTAFNAVMSANPVMLIVIGIAALAAGLIYAYKKSETFRNIVNGAFHLVWAVIKGVWGWIKGHWPLLLGILLGPFGLAVGLIIKHWDGVTGFFKAIPGRLKSILGGVKDVVLWPFQMAFKGIAWLWNNTIGRLSFHVPGWVPGVGGKGWSAPKIDTGQFDALPPDMGGIAIATDAGQGGYAPGGMKRMHSGGHVIGSQYINLMPNEEIVALPDGTTVIPLDNDAVREFFGDGDDDPKIIQVVLDGKVVAESTYKHTRRKAARK